MKKENKYFFLMKYVWNMKYVMKNFYYKIAQNGKIATKY